MPDGVAIRSLLWSTIRFPEPEIEVHKNSQLRREGILALSETVVERTIPMVARKRSGEPDAGGTSTAVAVGGWRSGSGQRCGGGGGPSRKKVNFPGKELRAPIKNLPLR